MKIGIFFGGQSREREISFAGGRTVYDNLNKALFTPIPIFVDSLGRMIELDWKYVYKGTIRDFYPPFEYIPETPNNFQIYVESAIESDAKKHDLIAQSVGKIIEPSQLAEKIDFAFLALHGPYGEDGAIQGLLDWYNIPYSGSGKLASAIGINKAIQKKLMKQAGFDGPDYIIFSKSEFQNNSFTLSSLIDRIKKNVGIPYVVKAPSQGSSIGISIVESDNETALRNALLKSFFIQEVTKKFWDGLTKQDKVRWIATLCDIREGIGLPATVLETNETIYHPEKLLTFLDSYLQNHDQVRLESLDNEEEVIIESMIRGQEFSCIVVQDENGKAISLPPTGIIKGNQLFDYRSKYLPGMSRKVTPIELPDEQIQHIRKECERLFDALGFNVYARLDGFITSEGKVFLNDPNTTSGMMPSSFFFHQAAEIGLNPSQFLTYIIRTSLQERLKEGKKSAKLKKYISSLDENIHTLKTSGASRIKVGVIMGGYSSERHISVESGRNIYEKLSSSEKYEPTPIFLTGNDDEQQLYTLPINIMLKDNADDIKEKVEHFKGYHPIIDLIKKEAKDITTKYAMHAIDTPEKISYETLSKRVDAVFIALHGRPGEDGNLQKHLIKYHVPFNGSGVKSSSITINKFETNKILRSHGISVANHRMVLANEWSDKKESLIDEIEKDFNYPLICKPSDDGCSSAVKKIKTRDELRAYIRMMFGEESIQGSESSKILNIKYNEEFPQKNYFLLEELISPNGAAHFIEVTGGLMTKYNAKGEIEYEIFEPSEALATGDVLSLEEKFLAGEGQNITPARYTKNKADYEKVAAKVRATLKKTAEILDIQGYARIDAFVRVFDNLDSETIIIEVNSLPGMTPATCIFHQTAINGYKPYDFIDQILTYGIIREKEHAQTLV